MNYSTLRFYSERSSMTSVACPEVNDLPKASEGIQQTRLHEVGDYTNRSFVSLNIRKLNKERAN